MRHRIKSALFQAENISPHPCREDAATRACVAEFSDKAAKTAAYSSAFSLLNTQAAAHPPAMPDTQ